MSDLKKYLKWIARFDTGDWVSRTILWITVVGLAWTLWALTENLLPTRPVTIILGFAILAAILVWGYKKWRKSEKP